MHRFIAGTLVPAFVILLAAAGTPMPAAADGVLALTVPVRAACEVDGRCYETGDPGYRDDDAPPPPRLRYDPDDNERPRPPPPRRRYNPDDDDRPPPPPPRRRYDLDDDDRPPPPPRRRYDPDRDD